MAVNGIIGIKLGMTQIFQEDGTLVGCTVLQAGPCVVVQRRTADEGRLRSRATRPGGIRQAAARQQSHDRAFQEGQRSPDESAAGSAHRTNRTTKPRSAIACWSRAFKPGELVDVSGVSKGKGFAGGVKRWHYAGGDATHGSMFHRAPGGIGGSSFPSRVWKNQHFPGHMGNARVTARNLRVVKVDTDENLAAGARFGSRTQRLVHFYS